MVEEVTGQRAKGSPSWELQGVLSAHTLRALGSGSFPVPPSENLLPANPSQAWDWNERTQSVSCGLLIPDPQTLCDSTVWLNSYSIVLLKTGKEDKSHIKCFYQKKKKKKRKPHTHTKKNARTCFGSGGYNGCCANVTDAVQLISEWSLSLCHPMGCSNPGFPVLHCLLEFAQTHVHWVGDAFQPSHPLSPPSPALNHGCMHISILKKMCALNVCFRISIKA